MAVNGDEVSYLMRREWNELRYTSKEDILTWRRNAIRRLDGDLINPIFQWPRNIRRIFFQNAYPIGDTQTFTLYLFFVGNGVSPFIFCKWILTSIALKNWVRRDRLAAKRIRQMKYIQHNLDDNRHRWRYFDLDQRRVVYLNGQIYNI